MKLGKRLAEEVHAEGSIFGYGSTIPVYYHGIKIMYGPYTTWKECYEVLIANLLSHLQSEEYSELRRQVGKVIERYVFDTRTERGHTLNFSQGRSRSLGSQQAGHKACAHPW